MGGGERPNRFFCCCWVFFLFFFFNATVLLWVIACKQVRGLSQGNESHLCAVCFPAYILLKLECPLWLLSFGLTTFMLTYQLPWCLASCFQTPFNCSRGVGEITGGLTKANWSLLWKCYPLLCSLPLHIFQHHSSWQQQSPQCGSVPF